MEKLKKHVNTHLERLDKKTSITTVTILEVRSQIHRLENTMEDHLGHMPEQDNPSWLYPGDIVQLNAPENYATFHDQGNSETHPNRQHQEENLARDEEIWENHGNTPHGLSPPQNYIPAGAEGSETSSSASIHNEEETLEEELENYFNNPSYRAAGPPPLVPIDSEEDWRDTSPVPFPSQAPQELPQPTTRFEHKIKVGNRIEPVIFEPQRKFKLSRSTYKVTSYEDFKPYKQSFKQFGQYICDAAQVWGGPRATEHTKECLLPRRPGC